MNVSAGSALLGRILPLGNDSGVPCAGQGANRSGLEALLSLSFPSPRNGQSCPFMAEMSLRLPSEVRIGIERSEMVPQTALGERLKRMGELLEA